MFVSLPFNFCLSLSFSQESLRKSKDELNTKIKKLTEEVGSHKENYQSTLDEIEKLKKSYDDERMKKIQAVNKLGMYRRKQGKKTERMRQKWKKIQAVNKLGIYRRMKLRKTKNETKIKKIHAVNKLGT